MPKLTSSKIEKDYPSADIAQASRFRIGKWALLVSLLALLSSVPLAYQMENMGIDIKYAVATGMIGAVSFAVSLLFMIHVEASSVDDAADGEGYRSTGR